MNELLDGVNFWAGTEDSLQAYLLAASRLTPEILAEAEKRAYGRDVEAGKEREPRLFKKQGSIATITISGSLNNSDSWINQYMGYTGYPEIREALVHAAKDPEVQAIVLDVKSGGGAVSGVSDTGELIKMISAKLKPVHTYSDGMIASAAYWLGSSAKSVTVGKVTEVGSIGVMLVHMERSEYLKKEGLTATVLRAGKYKALGNPYEALGKEGREQYQAQLDQMYQMFVEHVADARGVTYPVADKKMADGQVFIGQSAVEAGLADKVSSFDAFMGSLQAGIDKKKQPPKYGSNQQQGTVMPKASLTPQEVAALAAGVALASLEGEVSDEDKAAAAALAEKEAADKAAADKAAAVLEAANKTAAVPAAPAPAADTSAQAAVVAMLNTQLSTAHASVVALNVELGALKAASEGSKAVANLMRPIVIGAVSNMRVAMGGSAAGLDSMGDDALVAEYSNLLPQFQAKFKAGGVSGANPAAAANKGVKAEEPSSMAKARLAATGRNK